MPCAAYEDFYTLLFLGFAAYAVLGFALAQWHPRAAGGLGGVLGIFAVGFWLARAADEAGEVLHEVPVAAQWGLALVLALSSAWLLQHTVRMPGGERSPIRHP